MSPRALLTLTVLPDRYAICRFDAKAQVPQWAIGDDFVSLSRTQCPAGHGFIRRLANFEMRGTARLQPDWYRRFSSRASCGCRSFDLSTRYARYRLCLNPGTTARTRDPGAYKLRPRRPCLNCRRLQNC